MHLNLQLAAPDEAAREASLVPHELMFIAKIPLSAAHGLLSGANREAVMSNLCGYLRKKACPFMTLAKV